VVTTAAPAVIATYTRSGFTEGLHFGHVVVVDPAGVVSRSWGDPDHVIFPRSSNKPAQATAMVRHGLDLPVHLLALSASSHSGERMHLAGVREILGTAGLDESALQTPDDYPLDPMERDAWIADGRRAAPIAMNCSGKHAAMLATCVINDWPTQTYRDAAHPLQQAIRWQLEALAGEPVGHVGVDGCGAPVMSLTLTGLARSLSRAVQGEPDEPGRRVTSAMAAFPDFVGGSNRDVTAFMRAVPGLVAKDGAEGVYVAALPDGTAIAIKSEDGSDRARQVALATVLVGLGADPDPLAHLRTIPLSGGGAIVGEVSSPLG
jgi:L-asparaginase II